MLTHFLWWVFVYVVVLLLVSFEIKNGVVSDHFDMRKNHLCSVILDVNSCER